MKKLKFVVSLTTKDNDYQIEQATAAEEAATKLNIDLEILYAENDAILQSQQLLKIIQSSLAAHPNGIIFEPVGGTAMPQVARAAASAGIAWVVLNRDVDYICELRRSFKVPIFGISSDHEEIGRIQGKQIAALLPKGGSYNAACSRPRLLFRRTLGTQSRSWRMLCIPGPCLQKKL